MIAEELAHEIFTALTNAGVNIYHLEKTGATEDIVIPIIEQVLVDKFAGVTSCTECFLGVFFKSKQGENSDE